MSSLLHALPRSLLVLPLWVRLSSTLLTIVLFIILYLIFLPMESSPGLLAIPVAQAAWMFRHRGTLISIAGIVTVILFCRYRTLLFSFTHILSFLAGILTLLIIGLLIGAQRSALDAAITSCQKLKRINEQHQQLNQLKDQFILNINHELRTPLTTVYGYLELLLEHQEHMDRQKQRDFLKNALYSCEELQLLVNNVLDTMQTHYEKPLFAVERLSIAELIQEVVVHIDPRRQQEHNLQLDIPEHLFVRANAQYVRQILHNLLSNAFKYTPVDTPVEIKAALCSRDCQEKERPPMVCISVRDSGPGIPAHELPHMFRQFFRLERDISRKIRGTGLGLYVSKQLVEAMGGCIWVESSGILGEGSLFRFTLPGDAPQVT